MYHKLPAVLAGVDLGSFDGLNINDIAIAALIIAFCFLLQKQSHRVLTALGRRISIRPEESGITRILTALQTPLSIFIMLLGLYGAIHLFALSEYPAEILLKTFRSFCALLILWWLYNMASNRGGYIQYQLEERLKVDPAFSPVMLNIIKVLIVIIGLVLVAGEWGYDLTAIVAGLGLGGLALALAAKDTLANLFGGFIILTEKPFKIGDWVQTRVVDGVVEEIGFRSCRFRTFTQAVVTVPNYALTNEAITNWSKAGKRRIDFNLPLALSTPAEALAMLVDGIKALLNSHEGVHQETINVCFERLSGGSLDVFVCFYTIATDQAEYLNVKEDVNYRILALMDQSNIVFQGADK